jgi:hypothetical protein
MTNRSRILIADDHTLAAELCKRLLETEYDVVGIVSYGRTLVHRWTRDSLTPDTEPTVEQKSLLHQFGLELPGRFQLIGRRCEVAGVSLSPIGAPRSLFFDSEILSDAPRVMPLTTEDRFCRFHGPANLHVVVSVAGNCCNGRRCI